jgi:beta-glucanase (GH16 family)
MQMFSHTDPAGNANQPQHKRPVLWFATLLVIGSLVLAALSFMPLGKTSTARAANRASSANVTWNQIWSDEFNGSGGTGVNTNNWLYDTGTGYPGGPGGWGTGEVETMTNSTSNVYQDGNGHLAINPIRDGNGNWTSGRIETQRTDFAAPAGGEMAVEASIQMPNVTGAAAQGYWPAFWMLGSAFRGNYNNWPGIGEIDTMENVNGTNREYGTLHCGVNAGGPCNETTGRGGSQACSSTTCQAGFHTYRVEVDRSSSPEQIRWYLDGVQFWQVSSNDPGMDATTWANAVDHGFFVILNVAMGGGWPGNPSASTASGVPMLVDYVRVYTTSGSTPPPTPTPTPTSGCTSGNFAQGVVNSGSNTALPWFQLCNATAGYVILHYNLPGNAQQNVYMSYNNATSRWEYNVGGMSPGETMQYSFTYQENGLQYDTGSYSWTHP